MSKNELYGIFLIVLGAFDFWFLPKLFKKVWERAKVTPSWGGSVFLIIRIIGVILIFFGFSYYFFGQLE